MGPINKDPKVGGYPAWFQDKTGISVEFCSLLSQAELDGGWCVLIPPGLSFPENFPTSYFDEHFYYIADNGMADPAGIPKARLVLAVEAAFANGAPVDGDQMTFGRHRVFIPTLPWDGDYRVITPYSDITYTNQAAGERIFETSDIGVTCPDFVCTLNTVIGPFVLPSPVAGGAEVPPMPALAGAPRGTDPWYDLLGTATTPNPGTGKSYLADPARIGPVTGSPLPDFREFNDPALPLRNHNTFRIEVTKTDGTRYALEGENNFAVSGRLMDAPIPGKVTVKRANYKADGTGNVTDLDVFATGSPTSQARVPAQPQPAPVMPILSFVEAPCGGSLTTDPATGNVTINNPPYTAPVGVERTMAALDSDFWGQSQPGTGTPPPWVCVKDATSRNSAGQVVPSYYLKKVTDSVKVSLASYDGAANGTLKINAVSSDPTATLMLAGYGPAPDATPGVLSGKGAGTGLVLAGNVATVSSLVAPPAEAQVTSSKGGSATQPVETSHGAAVSQGVPVAVNDNGTMFEDCSQAAATVCAVGQGSTHDLLANDTVLLNGQVMNLRNVLDNNLATVTVDVLAPRMGLASVANGRVTYTPNPNANGTDSIAYTVTVNGQTSNSALLNINITPVNDAPVAVNGATAAVVSKPSNYNMIANATDPDGSTDVKDAVIVTWPANGLGIKPTPTNGVISYTPNSTGTFSFTYQVKDAAGLLSANTATTTVTVAGSEAIAIVKSRFTGGKIGGSASARWVVTGTDSVLQGQTLTIVYNNGKLKNQLSSCNGTATIPDCVIDTTVVDATGAYAYDKVRAPGGPLDPTDTSVWATTPTSVKIYSSAPALGGSATRAIEFK